MERSRRLRAALLVFPLAAFGCAHGVSSLGESGEDASQDAAGDDGATRQGEAGHGDEGPPPGEGGAVEDDEGGPAAVPDATADGGGSPEDAGGDDDRRDAAAEGAAEGGDASGDATAGDATAGDATAGDATAGDATAGDAAGTGFDASEDAADAGFDAPTDGAANPPDVATDGPPSGCSCGARSACVGGVCTAARRVFVSSKTYDGNLNGHGGADAACQALADAAGLGGAWMAWLSDGASSPGQRFSRATVPYRLLDGTAVAANWAGLVAGAALSSAIDLDETGASLAALDTESSKTWSATSNAGAPDTANCGGFASNATTAKGEVGHCTDPTSGSWTAAYAMEPCSRAHHLYCFEQ